MYPSSVLRNRAPRLLALGLALAGVVVVVGCQRAPTPGLEGTPLPTPAPRAVDVAKVERGEIASTVGYTGDVRATSQVLIVPKVSGRLEKLNVEVGSVVKAGDVIAEVEHASLDAQVAQAQAALDAAEAKLASIEAGPRPEAVVQAEASARIAQEKLAALKAGPRAETVAQARANVDAANAKLDQLKAGATPEQIAAAELAADQARNALHAAQASRDGVCGNNRNPQFLCDTEEAKVNAATTAIDLAEQQVKILTAGPTAEQLAQAEAAVAAAEEQLRLAANPITEHDLNQAEAAVVAAEQQAALARKPYTEPDRRAAQAAVDQARAALDLAKLQRQEATIVVPIEGVVAERQVSVGATVGPTTPIVSLVAREVKVAINVEESRLGLVKPGQTASVTVAAYPGKTFAAKVKLAAPTVESRSRTALVELVPEDTEGLLKPGMFAQVTLQTDSRQDALLIPKTALIEESGKTVVYAVSDGMLRRQEVQVGLSDGDRVEVLQGLQEGQEIVTRPRPDLRDGDAVLAQRG